MKLTFKLIFSLFLAVGSVFISSTDSLHAETVRRPIKAGSFYPSAPSELRAFLAQLTIKAKKTSLQNLPKNKLRAIILPHAGYIYSGWTAAHASWVLHPHQFAKVILLGPDHHIGFNNGAICDVTAYETPLGKIKLHQNTAALRLQPELFHSLPVSLDNEHSLEVVLPFLQIYLGEFHLIPIMVGRADINALSTALDAIIDSDTLIVISSDLSHFLSYTEAVKRDRDTINQIMKLNPTKLIEMDNRACGVAPILILMEMARRHHWQPMLLHYSNSGDIAGSHSRVVGYAAIAFFGELPMEKNDSNARFTEQQGQLLVELARKTIAKKLTGELTDTESATLAESFKDDSYQAHCGTFVTLKIKGKLRGCIGNLTSTETILDGVKRNAVNAAFHDPRFASLSATELDRTDIEVSILTEPRRLNYRNARDLIQKLRINVDGVIIRKGQASATFLPQVWEQLSRPEDFLTHLCLKAGLPSDAWKSSGLEVLTYQVQYFEEEH